MLSSLIIRQTRIFYIDPLTAVVIALFVVYPTYTLLRDSVHILMEGTPSKIDPDDVDKYIRTSFTAIRRVKDLHIWGLSPQKIILAVRIRTDGTPYDGDHIRLMKQRLLEKYGFYDIYLEIYEDNEPQGGAAPLQGRQPQLPHS
jgi:cobalt-zinc-cadmium efflux system protein